MDVRETERYLSTFIQYWTLSSSWDFNILFFSNILCGVKHVLTYSFDILRIQERSLYLIEYEGSSAKPCHNETIGYSFMIWKPLQYIDTMFMLIFIVMVTCIATRSITKTLQLYMHITFFIIISDKQCWYLYFKTMKFCKVWTFTFETQSVQVE